MGLTKRRATFDIIADRHSNVTPANGSNSPAGPKIAENVLSLISDSVSTRPDSATPILNLGREIFGPPPGKRENDALEAFAGRRDYDARSRCG
jgi:hypothetical protein